MNKKDKLLIKNNWISVYYSKLNFAFEFAPASYFDNRWHIRFSIPILISLLGITTSLILGAGIKSLWFLPIFFLPIAPIYLDLPIRSKWDECDPPKYGISYHDNIFWFAYGGKGNMRGGVKYWTLHMPWKYTWVRTSKLKQSAIMANAVGTATAKANYKDWIHETKGKYIDFYDYKISGLLYNKNYPYTYNLKSGKVQNVIATVGVEEREWRMKWLKWTSLFTKIRRDISINFDQEVGEETGSWKGGCTACGYNLKPGETPEQCLRRMEKERKF